MECPFLKKISFKKVNQIVTEDTCESLKEFDSFTPTDDDFDFKEDSIDEIQTSASNRHEVYYFNSKIIPPQKTNRPLQIKFPKQFQTKKMIRNYVPSLSEVQQDSIGEQTLGESEITSQKNIPHALISKMSMLTSKCEHIFQGEVQIEGQNSIYDCSLLDHCIKILKQQKVRYFIDLTKSVCRLENIKDCNGKLTVSQHKHHLAIQMRFSSVQKITAFCKALEINNVEIAHQKQMNEMDQHYNLNLSDSLDSLGFEVERIPIEKLATIGDNFDILLFKNKNLMSKVQRLFTNSDYDHVAMLLKTGDNEIYLLEASSNVGVAVYTLNSLAKIPRYKYYQRVGYRKYEGERKISQILRLQEFIKWAIGKPYKFDPMYLLSSEVKKDETYFCSQLVADALQKCGIMQCSKPAYKYLPKHFSIGQINDSMLGGKYSEIIMLQ